jgi:plastocyanin
MTGGPLIKALSRTTLLVLAAACLVPVTALGASATVDVGSFRYTPNSVSVDQGDTVTWNWVGPDKNHDVYEGLPPPLRTDPIPPALFESHPFIDDWTLLEGDQSPPGGTWSYTFNEPGTYDYWCRRHTRMIANVVVNPVEQPPVLTPVDEPVAQSATPPKAVCVSKRNFKIRIRQPKGIARIAAVKVTVNGAPVTASLEGKRFTAPVDLRGFASGTYEVQIAATTADGKTLRGTRRYKTCAAKLASAALPPL